MQMIPQGGGLRPPPWGILAFSRNREIRIASDGLGKVFFGFFWKYFQNQKSCWRLLAAICGYWAAIGWLLAAIGRLLAGYWRLLGGYWLPPEKLIASQ